MKSPAEREALRLGEYLDDEDVRRIEEAMRRVERATLARVRREIRVLRSNYEQSRSPYDAVAEAALSDALACCRPERSRRA